MRARGRLSPLQSPRSLRPQSGIAEVSQEEPSGDLAAWRVRAADADAAEHIAARLCAAGIVSVERLETASDLEELFLRLTASKAAHLRVFLP